METPVFEQTPDYGCEWREEHFHALVLFAVALKASDIKVIPDCPPYIRYYGRWVRVTDIVMSEHDIHEMIKWTSGNEALYAQIAAGDYSDYAFKIPISRMEEKRFRCNATGCVSNGTTGMSLVMRQIPDVVPTIEDVGMEPEILKNFFPEQGIVLVTGPTGSGKSTLMAAGLGYLRSHMQHRSLETYEDPVEFDLRNVPSVEVDRQGRPLPLGPLSQMQMHHHLRDFADIARNAARRSSDVILIGESRDKESFRGLVSLADMGMLTLSTLHTRSVAETVPRILNTFTADERDEIKASLLHGLRFVVQQRLLPSTDGKRVAVREWLYFDEAFRLRLSNLDMDELIPTIHEQVRKAGRLLIDDVREKFEQGRISKETYGFMCRDAQEAK